ncbi:hypothetical protein CQW23_18630 [Capsicum baccatum]|uniref:Disease resistance R13L4/SHOC-2-like LRR domain-containing protein n=1 Tax=Capsicum baccatum TaxID=33114 RepID=A0A2G2W3H1_CAPBA|nr:hypothetical protein CQW23_18630 [Capsicum baccatum]
MTERLKDACLLESHGMDSAKMHDVVRDVSRWIANSFGDEQNLVFQDGIGLTEISHIKVSTSVKRISFASSNISGLPDNFTECPEATTLLLQDNGHLWDISREFFLAFPSLRVLNLSQTGIRALPSSINSLCQLRALILKNCSNLEELPPIGNLCHLQLLDCDKTSLHYLPQGMDKLTNLRLLNLPVGQLKEIIGQGFFLSFSSIEMLNMKGICVGSTSLDEILSLHNLTSLFIKLDSSSIFNREPTWMTRLKRFHIIIGDYPTQGNINKSARTICVSECEIFSNGELSGMLQFASDLYLEYCKDLRKLIGCNSFNGLKSLSIQSSLMEEGIRQFDPFPNLEYLSLKFVYNLRSVSDFSQHLGFRFSKLRQLEISDCRNLKYLFKVGAFSIPKHLDEITVEDCQRLVALIAQYASTQTTLVNSEIPRVRKLVLSKLSKLTMLREPQRTKESNFGSPSFSLTLEAILESQRLRHLGTLFTLALQSFMNSRSEDEAIAMGRQQLGDNRYSLGNNAMNVLICLRDWIRAERRNQGMEPEPSDKLKLEEIMSSRENSAESSPMHGFAPVDFDYPMQVPININMNGLEKMMHNL